MAQETKQGLNRSSAVTVLRNFGFLTGGKALGDLLTFVLFVALSRTYGQEGIGQYSFAMALSGFFAMFADFGLYGLTIQRLSRGEEVDVTERFSRFLSLRLGLSITVLLLLVGTLPFLPFGEGTRTIVLLLVVQRVLLVLADGFGSVFVARQHTHVPTMLEAGFRALIVVAGLTVIYAGGSLAMAVAAMPAVTLIHVVTAYLVTRSRYGRVPFRPPWYRFRETLREIAPHAASVILFQLQARVDIVLLGFLIGEAAAGVYNVAYRVIFVLFMLPYFGSLALMPLASKLADEDRESFRKLYRNCLGLSVLAGIPVAAGVYLTGPAFTTLLFGAEFEASGELLRLLGGLLLLAFVNRFVGMFLTASDRQLDRTRSQLIGASVNVAGNLILIPILGVWGAAITTLASETIVMILYLVRLAPVAGPPRVGSRVMIGGAGALAFVLLFSRFPASLWVVIPASALIYAIVVLAFPQVRASEGRMLRLLAGRA